MKKFKNDIKRRICAEFGVLDDEPFLESLEFDYQIVKLAARLSNESFAIFRWLYYCKPSYGYIAGLLKKHDGVIVKVDSVRTSANRMIKEYFPKFARESREFKQWMKNQIK